MPRYAATPHPRRSSRASANISAIRSQVSLGTVSSVHEAVTWLSYSYLYVRVCRNCIGYGVDRSEAERDPTLLGWRTSLVCKMAARLDKAQLIRYHAPTGSLDPVELGRTAAHFYLSVRLSRSE